ncbi:MAG: lysophospholipase L1-like esterase [Marinoscillum sp.]|jgi:lysophospholipase L1-like esterase
MEVELINMEFEEEIKNLEMKIRDFPNKEDLVIFFGSSSLRLWENMEKDLAPINILNLGFGGSSFSWCIYYFDRLFSRIKPKHIVIYVGDNDLANGITPERVLKKFGRLSKMIRASFPGIPIDFMTIKPSPVRTYLLPQIRLTNNLIRKELMDIPKSHLINVFDSMLNERGEARQELYLEDELHLNLDGYRIWKGIVRKHFGI